MEGAVLAEGERAPSKWRLAASWLFSTNPVRVGILWIAATFLFFLAGGFAALVLRAELALPGQQFIGAATYNEYLTIHGTFMFFLFAVPITLGFGSILIPPMIGARNLAFPRLNNLDFWLVLVGGLTLEVGFLLGQRPNALYTSYVPLSLSQFSPGLGQDWWIWALFLETLGATTAGINFVTTILFHRRPDLRLGELPLFAWAILFTAATLALSTPFLLTGLSFQFLDRNLGTLFFDPATPFGVLLWQDLYWFDSHPAVYVMIIPAFGIISTILPRFAGRRIFAYKAAALSMAAVAFFGFLVWWHHMFVAGITPPLALFSMSASMAVSLPSGFLVFSWLATLYRGRIRFDTPMLFCLGFIAMFVVGGVSGVYTASIPVDVSLHDTYWVVAHIHYIIFGGTVLGFFAGFYYWFPHVFHRRLDEALGRWHFWTAFVGMNLTFLTMHELGLRGMRRRIWDYSPEFTAMNLVQTAGAAVIAVSVVIFLVNVALTGLRGRPVVNVEDPWGIHGGAPDTPAPEGAEA